MTGGRGRAVLVDDVGRHRSAAEQMVADESLLESVVDGGPAMLRLYTWSAPTLTIGRFQDDGDVDRVACRSHGVAVVRRPSGGRALLHGADLTYAVALRRPPEPVRTTYGILAAGLVAGLARLGVHAVVADASGQARDAACFSGAQGADLRVEGRKLCGSAMVRRGDAVLMHGAVLLARLPVDESVLVRGVGPAALRAATVTLDELGVAGPVGRVATALVEGFATVPGLELEVLPSAAERPRPPAQVEAAVAGRSPRT